MKTAISMPDDLYQAVIEYASGKKFSTTVCNLLRIALHHDEEVIPVNHTEVIPSNVADLRSKIVDIETTTRKNNEDIQGAWCQIEDLQSREKTTSVLVNNFDERFKHIEEDLSLVTNQIKIIHSQEISMADSFDSLLHRVDDLSRKDAAINLALPQLKDIIIEIDAINVRLSMLEGVAPGRCSLDVLAGKAMAAKGRINSELIPNATNVDERGTTKVQPEVIPEEKIILTEEMRHDVKEKISALRKIGKTYADISRLTGIGESMLKKLGNGYSVKMVSKCGYGILTEVVT
ncbi:hypothetical protein [uncultured Methanospirillum sp.]|uniref:hypothetical protein n=1 Tax=uncultured Methanospirillum sp. TaxID=262503 RepID=UPI0029C9070F|nr:hypothetical protein [uncultured Methanospirillum sp.]